jgi:hypothetical protein
MHERIVAKFLLRLASDDAVSEDACAAVAGALGAQQPTRAGILAAVQAACAAPRAGGGNAAR